MGIINVGDVKYKSNEYVCSVCGYNDELECTDEVDEVDEIDPEGEHQHFWALCPKCRELSYVCIEKDQKPINK